MPHKSIAGGWAANGDDFISKFLLRDLLICCIMCTIWFIATRTVCVCEQQHSQNAWRFWWENWEKLPRILMYLHHIRLLNFFPSFFFSSSRGIGRRVLLLLALLLIGDKGKTTKLDFRNKITTTLIIPDNLFKLCLVQTLRCIFTGKMKRKKNKMYF